MLPLLLPLVLLLSCCAQENGERLTAENTVYLACADSPELPVEYTRRGEGDFGDLSAFPNILVDAALCRGEVLAALREASARGADIIAWGEVTEGSVRRMFGLQENVPPADAVEDAETELPGDPSAVDMSTFACVGYKVSCNGEETLLTSIRVEQPEQEKMLRSTIEGVFAKDYMAFAKGF